MWIKLLGRGAFGFVVHVGAMCVLIACSEVNLHRDANGLVAIKTVKLDGVPAAEHDGIMKETEVRGGGLIVCHGGAGPTSCQEPQQHRAVHGLFQG